MLPDGICVTAEMVEEYYEAAKPTIKSLLKEYRDELMFVRMMTLEGEKLKGYKESYLDEPKYSRINSITLLPREAVLRVGMLLRKNRVAETVRSALLNDGKAVKDESPNVGTPARNSDLNNTVNNLFRYQSETMKQHSKILKELILATND